MRISRNITVLNNKLKLLMGITMMTACSGFLVETGTSHSVSNEMMTKEGKVNGFHNWRFHQNHLPSYPQNHHPLSHAMNRNKVSIEPRIVNGTNVNPPDKYSFMGALRVLAPLDEFHSTSYGRICSTILRFMYLMIDNFIFYDYWNRLWCNFDYSNYCSVSRYRHFPYLPRWFATCS